MKKIIIFIITCVLATASIDFTDARGEHIHLEKPAERIALGLYYQEYAAIAGEGWLDHLVGFSRATWAEWNANSYKIYARKFPALEQLADFGEGPNMSAERIIALEPDALVLAKVQYDAAKDALAAVQKAGIPVIVIDYHSGKFHEQSTKILGAITGCEQRAEQIWREYADLQAQINERTSKIAHKATAYVEYGYAGAQDHGSTYSHFMWGDLLDRAGLINIADGLVSSHGAINPETILIKDPDLIIIAGREAASGQNKTMLMGNEITFAQANERLKTFAARPGWSELKALKNGALYGGYHGMLRTLSDIFMVLYIAKAAYPAEFADIDAKRMYQDFNAKYLPVVPEGIFMMKLDDENY